MTKNIFRAIVAASLVVLLFTAAMLTGVLYRYTTGLTRDQLRTGLNLASQGLRSGGVSYLRNLNEKNVRITWIAADGKVLYDNEEDPSRMKNHLKREEVQEALHSDSGYGESDRYSSTMMRRMLYAAEKQSDGTVLRMAVTQYSVWMLLIGMVQPFVIIIVLAILMAVLLAVHLSKKIVQPLNDLDLDHPLENENVDEVAPLLRRIANQKRQLTRQEESLERKQDELEMILDNMEEGMILLRRGGKIVSMNRPAGRILGIEGEHAGESLLSLCRNLDLSELIQHGLDGKDGSRVLSLDDGKYQVQVAPVREDGDVKGVTVVLFDVTAQELSEEMRREFTANVSHELKTPLHAISGYAELLKGGVVKDADIPHFSEKIYTEAQRTIRLVEDIISLSHLDENADDLIWEKVNLLDVAQDAASRLGQKASEQGVSLKVTGHDAFLEGNAALLSQIAVNLTDNAVKYNHEGGHVRIIVSSSGRKQSGARHAASAKRYAPGSPANAVTSVGVPGNGATANGPTVSLTVKDDGIGIPKEDQKRIFERFYRVDKSHSREVGGTGLGLSIVKHAVLAHHGRITLKSAPGAGTEITVTLPMTQEEKKTTEA